MLPLQFPLATVPGCTYTSCSLQCTAAPNAAHSRPRTLPRRLQKQVAYGRAMAVASMAGYVIGLGDRHLNNVLIDTRTAEPIHIDLGIAFEGGTYLPTPEESPFRCAAVSCLCVFANGSEFHTT